MDEQIKKFVRNYQPPDKAKDLIKKSKVVLLVGISGAGKDAVIKELLKLDKYRYIVSHTTRKPRRNKGVMEEDGVDYHFVETDKVKEMLKNNEFVEAKFYSGNVYGTSIRAIMESTAESHVGLTEIEVQGVEEYKNISSEVIAIFLLPPDYATWQQRLKNRYSDKPIDPSDFALRVSTAADELREALSKNYYEFVINDDLKRTVWAVDEIVNGNTSKKKNDEAKEVAQELLTRLLKNE